MRVLLLILTLGALVASLAPDAPPERLDRARLGGRTFDAEFDAPLDLFAPATRPHGIWTPFYWFGWRPGGACLDPSCRQVGPKDPTIASDPAYNGVEACAVRGGALELRIGRADPANPKNGGKRYTACVLTTESSFAQRYGYFEARMALPSVRGAWPAFWMLAKDRGTGAQREIDVIEGQGAHPDRVTCTAIWAGGGASGAPVPVVDTSKPHTYGVLWTPEAIAWYVDDVEVRRTRNLDLDAPMYLLVSMGAGGWTDNATPDPTRIVGATARVDWVRAYTLKL